MIKIKPFLFSFTLLVFSFLYSFPVEAATIRISAPKIELELAPGETYSGEIAAENPTEDPANVKIYMEDWKYAPGGTGEKKFFPAGTTDLSSAKWISFSPTN